MRFKKILVLFFLIGIVMVVGSGIIKKYSVKTDPPHYISFTTNRQILSASDTSFLPLKEETEPNDVLSGTVIDVIDLNTIRVLSNNKLEDVDLIALDIPSESTFLNFARCYGVSLPEALQKMVIGKKAYFISDSSISRHQSSYQPRYVFLEDLSFLNLEMIKNGLALLSETESTDYLYRNDFTLEEAKSKLQKKGVWADDCAPTPTPQPLKITKTPTPTKIPTDLYSRFLDTPTPQPSPTSKPTSTPKPIATATPVPPLISQATSSAPANSLNPEILFVLINNHRKSIGKIAFEKDTQLCNLAKERGPELSGEVVTGNFHTGLYNRNLPYWITENMAYYPSEEQIFNWWMGSVIHRRAIEGDYKYSCGQCSDTICAQLFTSYIPK